MGISRQQRQIRKVMIVEDEQDILLLYKDYLKSKGHFVIVSSTTADEVLVDYEKYAPDIVIIDYKLPGKKMASRHQKKFLSNIPQPEY
jgi:DNA-binding response OmpR family regulator